MARKPSAASAPTPRETLPAAGEGKRGEAGHIAYLLRQAHGAVRAALDAALAEAGLTSPQFLVLNLLDAYPGISGAELARLGQLTPQTINLVVRRLERDALVARDAHETHGRVLRVALTAAGRARLKLGKRYADRVEERLLAGMDAQTARHVRRWLVAVATTQLGA